MILFYNKTNGEIFATVDGRVHDEAQLNVSINNGLHEGQIGKYVIGYITKGEQKIEQNMDKFEILQDFESNSPSSPLDYKIDIETNNLIKK